jgi:ubiquinone/menaquinone biosynthesis C-methylase UbiE
MKADAKFSSWEDAVQWLRNQPTQQELVRAAFYDDPLAAAAVRYWLSSEWRKVQFLIGAGHAREALDIGAGRGIASFALAKDGFTVTALEPDPSDLVGAGAIRALATTEQLDIRVVQEVSERLPFESDSFDIVFARAVLHHTKDLRAACNEIFRVLKPGGMLLAVREHVVSHDDHLQRFLELHPLHKLYGGEHAYRKAAYVGALVDSGFSVVTLKSFDSPINYFPHTEEALRDKLIGPLRRIPLVGAAAKALLSLKPLFNMTLRLMSWADRRPGRLYSFICRKPA